jgi:DNA-binding beta-propeller fold protein YncE
MVRVHVWWLSLLIAGGLLGGLGFAQDEKKAEDKPAEEKKAEEKKADEKPAEGHKTKEVIVHLDNPSGVCVQPNTQHVFVVAANGVFRYVRGNPHKIYLEIDRGTNPVTDVYGKGPMYNIGPLGCAMWGNDRLIVTDGSLKDGSEVVRIYKVGDQAPQPKMIPVEGSAEFTLGPIAPGDDSPMGEGNFYAAALWNDVIYVTSNGDDTKGWVLKSEIKDGKPGPLVPAIATKPQVEVDAPEGITVSPDGSVLVISQGGEVNMPGDSLITTYNAEGKLVKKYATGLHDICGIAYSPVTKKLYGVDFAWIDPAQGGLFELAIEGDECKASKVPLVDDQGKPVSLDRPTSLAFDKEGRCYITVFGTGKDTGDKPKGGMIRVEPGL